MRIQIIRGWVLGLLLGALLSWCPKAEAAGFIKFDGVDGESKDSTHSKWIELQSVQLTRLEPRPGGGCGASPSISEIVVTKACDSSTPLLQQAACNGGSFRTVLIHVHAPGGENTYLTYELENALITSYSVGSSPDSRGEAIPIESLTINFATMDVQVLTDRHR